MTPPRFFSSFAAICAFTSFLFVSGIPPVRAAPANPSEIVNQYIEVGSYGRKPVVWYRFTANQNLGSGSPTLTATSGGRLNGHGFDPWGARDSAFGPSAIDKTGVAITGSGSASVMPYGEGSLLFFYRAPSGLDLPAILVNRGDFSQPGCLGLRISKTTTGPALTLLRPGAGSNETKQIWIAPFQPEEWTFVAASWTEQNNIVKVRYWSGTLSSRELTEGEDSYTQPPLTPAQNKVVLIGGRKRDQQPTSTLVFTEGLFHQLAFYDYALTEETVKDIYLAACRR